MGVEAILEAFRALGADHYGVHIHGLEYQELGTHFGLFGAKVTHVDELRNAFQLAPEANQMDKTAILNVALIQ